MIRVENGAALPRQPWWRRLLGLKRPAGVAFVQFSFRNAHGRWERAEATAHYPEGIDEVRLRLEFAVDEQPVFVSPVYLGTKEDDQ